MTTMDRAVGTLCDVIALSGRGVWIVDPRSGIRPQDFRDHKFDVVMAHAPRDTIRVEQGQIDRKALNHAIHAVSNYVSRG